MFWKFAANLQDLTKWLSEHLFLRTPLSGCFCRYVWFDFEHGAKNWTWDYKYKKCNRKYSVIVCTLSDSQGYRLNSNDENEKKEWKNMYISPLMMHCKKLLLITACVTIEPLKIKNNLK